MHIAFQWLRIADAGNPREQSVRIRKRASISGDIADAYATWLQNPFKLRRRRFPGWEGAERALTEDGVECAAFKRERLCIGQSKVHQLAQAAYGRFVAGVHGSMKFVGMFFAMSPRVRLSGRPHAWQDTENCSANFCEPDTSEEDQSPSRALFTSRLKSGITRFAMQSRYS